jgi:hypothetical protein
MLGVAVRSPEARDRVDQLVALALRGLQRMYVGAGAFVQTVRGIETDGSRVPRPEGDSLRYAAIVALGLSRVDEEAQRGVLKGRTAADLAAISRGRVAGSPDIGAVALGAWAAAEVAGVYAPELFSDMDELMASGQPVETVACSWILMAALAARALGPTSALADLAAHRLLAAQAPTGLFPHLLPPQARGRHRAHVGCFADQVYPIQALARLYASDGEPRVLEAAEACARSICDLQGEAGQWWWHYDTRDGSVVEGYPVYSVHQHAMGPMALFELREAGGRDRLWPILRGLNWIDERPESTELLVSEHDALVWRKIGRREPTKAVRSISAMTTGLKSGWHLPGLDIVFPPDRIDYECRPYELGWLLYAWKSPGAAANASTSPGRAHG